VRRAFQYTLCKINNKKNVEVQSMKGHRRPWMGCWRLYENVDAWMFDLELLNFGFGE